MAKISSYAIDATPTLADKVIGTDVNDSNITKNYTLGDIISLVPPIPSIVTDLFVPISNGVDYVDSIITQDSTILPETINVGGRIGITGTGESVFIGKDAGIVSDVVVPQQNIGIGDESLKSFIAGINPTTGQGEPGVNIAIGFGSLAKTTTGTNNVGIGVDSLKENTEGFNNVAISKNALGSSVNPSTQGITFNQGSIGIGFSAGNPNANSSLPAGHNFDTIVGHQAMADIFYLPGSTTTQNTVLGMRALRSVGVQGYGSSISENVVIGAAAGLGIKAGPFSQTPGVGDQNNVAVDTNVFIGKNAGNNFRGKPGFPISKNIIIGAASNNQKYVTAGNVVISTGGTDNGLGSSADDGTVSSNFLVGSRTSLFSNSNIVLNPNTYGPNTNRNVIGTANMTNMNVDAVKNNIILGDKLSSITNDYSGNTLLSETTAVSAAEVGKITGSLIVNSANTTMLSNNGGTMDGNVIINGDSNAITASNNSNNNDNNYILGSNNVSLFDTQDNFVFATTPSSVYQLNSIRNNFLWGVAVGTVSASITDGSDSNFLFNTPSISLTGNSNTVFGGAGTISGDGNVILNGGGHSITGTRNVVFGQNSQVINGTQRAFVSGFGNKLGTVAASNNSFITGNNNKIVSQANNSILGSNLVIENSGNTVVVGQNNDETVFGTQGKGSFQVGVGNSSTNRKNALHVSRVSGPLFSVIYLDQLVNGSFNHPDDTAAAASGIGFGGLYHTDGVVKINITP